MDRELKLELDRINKKLNALAAAPKKSTWVSHGWITDLTGWDKEKLRQARDANIIEFKKSSGGGYLYKLESIPEIFIKQIQT